MSFSTSSVDSNATEDDEDEDVEGLEVEVSDEELEEVDDGLESFGDPLWLSDGAGPDPESKRARLGLSKRSRQCQPSVSASACHIRGTI